METPDGTTEFAREIGEIAADQRIYSIDGYSDGGNTHETYALLKKQPTYDEFRDMVVRIVKGETQAVSSTVRKGPAAQDADAPDSDEGSTEDNGD
jgi:hypothetical protein